MKVLLGCCFLCVLFVCLGLLGFLGVFFGGLLFFLSFVFVCLLLFVLFLCFFGVDCV